MLIIDSVELVNLTPHDIKIYNEEKGLDIVISPSGTIARTSYDSETVAVVNGIPVTKTVYTAVSGLPAPSLGKIYLVSRMVLEACPQRIDLLAPDRILKDVNGNVSFCESLRSV